MKPGSLPAAKRCTLPIGHPGNHAYTLLTPWNIANACLQMAPCVGCGGEVEPKFMVPMCKACRKGKVAHKRRPATIPPCQDCGAQVESHYRKPVCTACRARRHALRCL